MIYKTIKIRPLIMNFKPHLHTLVRERYKIKMHGPTILFLILRFLTLLMPVRGLQCNVKPLNCFSTKITKLN